MPDRLTSLDASFLVMEDASTPMHVGSVMVFDSPPGGFDHDAMVDLIAHRLAFVPRYRQRVRGVPGGLANPVWVDDEHFDVGYHVRRSALPRPGTDAQLEELVARIMPRPLDRHRPLWEVYLVEGLAEDRFAILTKTHHALVDGYNTVDIGQVILDGAQDAEVAHPPAWRPSREPTGPELLVGAIADSVRGPAELIETVRSGVSDVKAAGGRAVSVAGEVISAIARASRSAPESPLNAKVGRARRYVMIGTDLEDHRRVRARLAQGNVAEDITVNDVVLATLAGAFRAWLLTRGEPVHTTTTIRAMVPVRLDRADEPGKELTACFVDLPIGEPRAAMRLHQISFAMRQQMEGGGAMGADTLAGLAGFAPPTMHAMGARLAGAFNRRLYNVAVTNVPGPQRPLYAAGAAMVSSYPVMPLSPGQGLSIGLTSYDGGVYYGLYADRDAFPDLDVLGHGIVDGLQELLDAPRARGRRS
ncbi:MAG TPA: wax ester/triacylglycerol synthase family O-acyltransferase [Phycicoccus elongatus]|uniref:WS/DGAT/MGAT family O-acyltransferase n=1 Tax=Phycicoccus TaxID=367298 RepID=UPI00258E343A|nr:MULTISPECIES: wax ester/triacylglycerol synthase family O-acyltransferase [Phycicoccus]MBK8728451.1 wax ester/triacylglycerol synthase family O-acyltransferase [Tetrasphaera sp.]MCA0321171.1 wax ester/triacylglycerol synthase family O-acyltransferase [Actinomycetota bacterium]MCB9407337.1 wax ester/triacylglycerol synthase family O-acyltransferase [Tetrasphaera sp.]MCO5302341.1 wax ester/triacylglycerol synthase family O-acyltransferase [Phycicoccus sp.]HPF75643.1 wax ester/triacylglycerol 